MKRQRRKEKQKGNHRTRKHLGMQNRCVRGKRKGKARKWRGEGFRDRKTENESEEKTPESHREASEKSKKQKRKTSTEIIILANLEMTQCIQIRKFLAFKRQNFSYMLGVLRTTSRLDPGAAIKPG